MGYNTEPILIPDALVTTWMALSCPFQSPQYRRICLQPKLRISCSTTIRSEVRQLAFWPCSTPSILSSWNSIISSPLKIKKFWLFLKKPVILMKKSFFFNSVSCSLAFESDLSKSNSITWLDYKLHFPYWVFLWAVQKRLLTTHQEKYKKYFWKWKKGKKILPNQIFTTFHNQYIVIERNEIVFSLFKGELNKLWRLSFIMMVGFKISFVFALF